MPRVTALHAERGGRVRVELDGEPWRTIPAGAVVAAGMMVGVEVDRPRARELRRAMRRSNALKVATRALASSDRSVADLAGHLQRRGVAGPERDEALDALSRLGYVDDNRFAAERAALLARRGYGDEAIRFDLARRGIEEDQIAAAIEQLDAEADRARAAVPAGTLPDAKTLRRLAAKGFSSESLEVVFGLLEP